MANTMKYASVRMQQKGGTYFYVTVDLILGTATETRFMIATPISFWQITNLKYPDMPKEAVGSACYSGAIAALREIDAVHPVDFGYVVVIQQVAGTVYEDATPWSIAAFVGVCHLADHPEIVTADKLRDWELLECRISYPI